MKSQYIHHKAWEGPYVGLRPPVGTSLDARKIASASKGTRRSPLRETKEND
jgi:hypothetical protein